MRKNSLENNPELVYHAKAAYPKEEGKPFFSLEECNQKFRELHSLCPSGTEVYFPFVGMDGMQFSDTLTTIVWPTDSLQYLAPEERKVFIRSSYEDVDGQFYYNVLKQYWPVQNSSGKFHLEEDQDFLEMDTIYYGLDGE